MWKFWKNRRSPGRIPSTFAKTLYSHSDKADSMSNRIGNSCHCREAYTPVHGRDRMNDLRAAREANRDTQALGPARFSGSTAAFQSEESADLVVKTADGDTVRISIDALTKAQSGVYSASAGGSQASVQTFSGVSSYSVKVSVKGSLDEKETKQIGDLLQKLVSASRGVGGGAATPEQELAGQAAAGQAPAPSGGSYDTLSSFRYAYRAYSEASQSTLDAQAA